MDNGPHGVVVWITGRPSAGKSLFAESLRARLPSVASCILDGDAVRNALKPTPGYSPSERRDFYASLVGLAQLLASQGLTVIVPATAASNRIRQEARALIPRFYEVFVDTPAEECERRDSKGLYREAKQGALEHVPGHGVPYEAPVAPEVVARGGRDEQALDALVGLLLTAVDS